MSIAGLIFALVTALVCLGIVLRPIVFTRKRTQAAYLDKQRERALAYYERVLVNVRDLDEDHATGKIAQDEYRTEREYWVARGVQVLKLFDELEAQHNIVDAPDADDATIDAAIEAAIDQEREKSA